MATVAKDERFTVYRDVALLHPIMREPVRRMMAALDSLGTSQQYRLRLFETYRTPVRQNYLLEQKTTKAGAFTSAHQFGLAADFVPWGPLNPGESPSEGNGFTWNVPEFYWKQLTHIAQQNGLSTPIEWDRPHVQHPAWEGVRQALR